MMLSSLHTLYYNVYKQLKQFEHTMETSHV